jgi:hypothetical protein
VNAYVEVTAHSDANDIGLVRAAFAASIQEELTDYYRLLAVMEAQLGCDINPMQVSTCAYIMSYEGTSYVASPVVERSFLNVLACVRRFVLD